MRTASVTVTNSTDRPCCVSRSGDTLFVATGVGGGTSIQLDREAAEALYYALSAALHDWDAARSASDPSAPLEISDESCPPGIDPLDLILLAGDPTAR